MTRLRVALTAFAAVLLSLPAGAAPAAAASAHAAALPVTAAGPWPEMRRDSRNTGSSPIVGHYHGDRPWTFFTGRGIFSTPVIAADGTIYVGSADTWFYALRPDGRVRWRFRTGGLIDAAAALTPGARGGAAAVTVGSGDATLYHLSTPQAGSPRVLWRFRPTRAPVAAQQVSWWEGEPAIAPNGDILDGNTGGTAYALTASGHQIWAFTAGNSLWTEPAFLPDGSTIWGSLDLHAYRLRARGTPAWSMFTPGYVVSSPAIGADGTVYVGSFNGTLYALNPATGTPRWTFPTSDLVYSSPALGHDAQGRTNAVYFASGNGSIYALTPGGRLLWRYDTGDPIRSSPVLGRAPGGGSILYVGSANGKLYALDARTGHRRWSFDTTPADPALRDRNDLNASPALGRGGVVIAGEDGAVDYVPYGYCLHHRDVRCDVSPGQDLGATVNRVFPVTSGGTTLVTNHLQGVSPASVLNLRLVVRRGGTTVNAAILDPSHVVTTSPRFPFTVQESGDGHFLYVVPRGPLQPATTYRIHVHGAYTDNGVRMGNFNPAGAPAGHFDQTITARTAAASGPLPLRVTPGAVSAITVSRLAVPMPDFLPAVNQIGFDSYDWIMSVIGRSRTRALLWVIGARRDARGVEHVDPRSAFSFPLEGPYQGEALAVSSANVPLQFSFGNVPLRTFTMWGSLTPDLSFKPGAALYSDTVCATVPNYGPELLVTGICNPDGILAASGTFLSAAYHGPAAQRPRGVTVRSVVLHRPTPGQAGSVTATLTGPGRPPRTSHVAAIVLIDAATGTPLPLDLRSLRTIETDRRGRITGVRLTLPAGTTLPVRLRAYLTVDAFPLGSRVL